MTVLLSVFLGLFLTLELTSISLTGNLIDYRFIEHADLTEAWSLRAFYFTEIIKGALFFIVLVLIFLFIKKKLKLISLNRFFYLVITVLLFLILYIPKQSVFKKLSKAYLIKNGEVALFDDALTNIGIDTETYITAENIEATPGKNIIVLSLESLEKGYLDQVRNSLTPHLNEIAKRNNLYAMRPNLGSDWTAASIYTSLTGVPAYFKANKNEEFKNTKFTNLGNLGAVLKKANYDMTYFLAKKDFSGLDVMLTHFGFDVKSEVDLPYPRSEGFWGLQDKELFHAATNTIVEKSKKNKPFAIFLNTISGHFPKGVYDKSMEGVLPSQESNLAFMTTAVDYYIGNLFKTLEEQNILENTVVYIYPDHLFMGDINKEISSFPKNRELFLLTTANSNLITADINNLSQMDIPRVIIDGAEIKTNATFISDFIRRENINEFIEANTTNLLSLNEPVSERYNFSKNIILTLEEENKVTISQEDGFKKSINNVEENKLYRAYFDPDMNILKITSVTKNEAFWRGETTGLIFSIREDFLYSYLLKGKKLGITKNGKKEVVYNFEEISSFEDWGILQPQKEYKGWHLYLKSVGYNSMVHRGMSYIRTGSKEQAIKRGFNIVYANNYDYEVTNFDTYQNKSNAKLFVKFIDSLKQANKSFAMVVHDTAGEDLGRLNDELEALGLNILAGLKNREAYTAVYDNDLKYFIENKDQKSVNTEVNLSKLDPITKTVSRNDTSRFIAHGGGSINNDIYTNSLEALNANYGKGFKLFELDIIETSDHKYVAAHDWEMWQKKTQFKGTLPPTEAQFKSYKISEKYTPLTMDLINEWFSTHADAILITDKVNDPQRFAPLFVDRERLSMELFSEDAINDANKIGIKNVLMSNNLIRSHKENLFQFIEKYDIKYLAASRKYVQENLELFRKLEGQNIKTYVFHINFEAGKDEEYVFNNEIGPAYGFYADRWEFEETN